MAKEQFLDGDNNSLKQGWYVGVFPGSSASASAKAVRSLHFIRKNDSEFLAYDSEGAPVRVTSDYAKNFFPLDVQLYISILRSSTDRVLGVVEKMVEEGVLPESIKEGIIQTLNVSPNTSGRGTWKDSYSQER